MGKFRRDLLTLPFVAKREDGTLDFWRVAATGDEQTDRDLGRTYAARCLHFCRAFDAPHIPAFVFEAMCRSGASCRGHIRDGYADEALEACLKAPANATTSLQIAAQMVPAMPSEGLPWLPFVRKDRGAGTDYWAVEPAGVWGDDTATGRLYGALTAQVMRLTGSHEIFSRIVGSMLLPGRFEKTRAVWTGWMTEIAEIEMASDPCGTPHLRANYHLHTAALRAA
jgi:hypothetical protein